MQLDASVRGLGLRLADGAVVVARHDVGDSVMEVHVVPGERRCLARSSTMPAKEEHEGVEGWMRTPHQLALKGTVLEPGGDCVPLLRREGIRGRRFERLPGE